METKEKTAEVELITKEQVDRVIETITQVQKDYAEEEGSNKSRFDFDKTKEVLRSLEGVSVQTVVTILSTAILLLPLNAMITVLDMGKTAIKSKTLSTLYKVLTGSGCPDCKGGEKCTDSTCPNPETKE